MPSTTATVTASPTAAANGPSACPSAVMSTASTMMAPYRLRAVLRPSRCRLGAWWPRSTCANSHGRSAHSRARSALGTVSARARAAARGGGGLLHHGGLGPGDQCDRELVGAEQDEQDQQRRPRREQQREDTGNDDAADPQRVEPLADPGGALASGG